MFNLSRIVLLKKARHALHEGRLDEAYSIVIETDLREHRQGQILSEKLVDPLLDRAEKHLADGRKEDALADVERAAQLGGNRPRTASLREKVLAALSDMRRDELREKAAIDSVRRHIRAGQLGAAEGRLDAVPGALTKKAQLEKHVKRLREEAEEAQARLRDHLKHGELTAALEVAVDAMAGAAAESSTRELILEVRRKAELALDEALVAGRFERVQALADKLERLQAVGPGEGRWTEALPLCRKASEAVRKGQWGEARVFVGRLRGVLPEAQWVEGCEEKLRLIEDAIHHLRCSPLEQLSSFIGRRQPERQKQGKHDVSEAVRDLGATCSVASDAASPEKLAQAPAGGTSRGRQVLWVDGVGSYLLLTQDRVTLGRAGSSARPDIPLSADIDGVHAEVLRVDGDYFVVARGDVKVGGRSVERHLLADGDELCLGRRTRLKFRLPTSLSSTAMLELASGLRVSGDVKKVVLVDENVLLGSGSDCHVQAREANGRVVLSVDGQEFRLKAPEPIVVNGELRSVEERIPLGVAVEAGSLTFTITAEGRGGARR